MRSEQLDLLERFYDLLAHLHSLPDQGKPLSDYNGRSMWPSRGVYFFLEAGETRRGDPATPRVVRVGTHGVSEGSRSTLWGRLRQHRGSRNGGGNHRGSIFRRHMGAALLPGTADAFPHWGEKQSASREVRQQEFAHEQRVSLRIGAMRVLWVAVPDEPSRHSERGVIERGAIALLSQVGRRVDPPSESWLGWRSAEPAIRESGLWNVNHVREAVSAGFLDVMQLAVERTARVGAVDR